MTHRYQYFTFQVSILNVLPGCRDLTDEERKAMGEKLQACLDESMRQTSKAECTTAIVRRRLDAGFSQQDAYRGLTDVMSLSPLNAELYREMFPLRESPS